MFQNLESQGNGDTCFHSSWCDENFSADRSYCKFQSKMLDDSCTSVMDGSKASNQLNNTLKTLYRKWDSSDPREKMGIWTV